MLTRCVFNLWCGSIEQSLKCSVFIHPGMKYMPGSLCLFPNTTVCPSLWEKCPCPFYSPFSRSVGIPVDCNKYPLVRSMVKYGIL